MVISFKSVGKTSQELTDEVPEQTVLPVGIKTPLRLGTTGEGIFALHYDLADQVNDNLRNLILTNWGERLALWDYGANLRELTTELASREDFDNEAVVRIKNAVTRWMPYVILNDFIPLIDHENNQNTAIINFRITYDVPVLGVTNRGIEITLYAI